jgi:hypothetical protein
VGGQTLANRRSKSAARTGYDRDTVSKVKQCVHDFTSKESSPTVDHRRHRLSDMNMYLLLMTHHN